MKKILKYVVIFIFVALVVYIGLIGFYGYKMYKSALDETSISEKINEIKKDKNYVALSKVSTTFKNAVVAVEDHRFYSHGGIDFISIGRAFLNNVTSFSLSEGGSTITQQLAKNTFFSQSKKLERKVAEILLAFDLEKMYSKDDILELYINTNYYGNGYYGIREASLGYYKKEPADLNNYEATLLAGVPNAPSVYSPTKNLELAEQRQKQVLSSMVEFGYLNKEQSDKIISKEN